MLKAMVIYSIVIIVMALISELIKILKSNSMDTRVTYFIGFIFNCPILYVLIKMLGML